MFLSLAEEILFLKYMNSPHPSSQTPDISRGRVSVALHLEIFFLS